MTRFSSATDKYKTNIIATDKVWGNARVLYKIDHGDWIPVYSGETKAELVSANKVVYTDYEKGMPIKMERTLEKVGKGIDFTINLQTMMISISKALSRQKPLFNFRIHGEQT